MSPLLTGASRTHHDTLYWSKGGDGEWAVRRGDWKLWAPKGMMELFNLAEDPSETTNLADERREMVKTLRDAYDAWLAPMAELYGLYPESTGVLDNKSDIRQTRPGTVSMPQRFKEAGYWTGSVGKVFHNPTSDPGAVAWNEFERFENDELPMVTRVRTAFEAEHGPIDQRPSRRLWKAKHGTIGTQTRGQQQPGYGPSGLRDEQEVGRVENPAIDFGSTGKGRRQTEQVPCY